jgi:broad specificity phosphatase PhoE
MPRIYMVRHGKAAAGFGEDTDPGLDATGHAQAKAAAENLKGLGPKPILSSPLKRCRETSAPLAALWNKTPVIEPRVAEIPSPKGTSLEERVVWLRKHMGGHWTGSDPALEQWRDDCAAAIVALKQDTVVFSHYVAINVLMGSAMGDDRVVVFSPDNCSITVFDNSAGKLRLLEKGNEASLTKVN